jgi:DNA-binding HxlR family transcriptional regulator
VEYALTDLGRSLSDAVRKLDGWAEAHIPQVQAARAAFAKRDAAAGREVKSLRS